MNFIRLNPELLVFKRISRQRDSSGAIWFMQLHPVDIDSRSPELAQRLQRATKT